ncbi:hypothetical protein M8J75_008507 [Diaphorina citri]|nr:hypothetical protein M8J75_008507 [Diaphorina citri]
MAPSDHRMPRVYKEGAKILKEVMLSKRGLKDVIYSNRNKMLYKKLFVLLNTYLDHQNSINKFVEETSLTQNVKDEFVAKILCTELLYGRKSLPSVENNTMNTVNKAYEMYCEQNPDVNSNSIFDSKTDCDTLDSTNHFISAKKKLRYVRVNTLMISTEDLMEKLVNDGFVQLPNANSYNEFLNTIAEYTGRNQVDEEYFIQDFHLNDVLVFLQSTQFHNYAPYKNGSLFLQDKASCFPTHLLSPPPHSVVFDTCAAPGNKTLHLAAYMQNQGKVYAVDKDPKRYNYMKEVVELAQGSGVVSTILSDIFDIKMADYTDVEYVLVDPSCSGTGITERAKIDNNASISAGRIRNLAGFQRDLLSRVCTYFTHVKRIVYCTCSVVEDIMVKHGDCWEVEDLTHHPALVGWKHFGSEKYAHGRRCFYALPSDYCTGFFAAVLTRKYDSPGKNSDGLSSKNIDGPTTNNTVGSGEKNIFSSTGKNSRREVEESKKTSEGELEEESSSQERGSDDNASVETLEQSKKKKKHKRKDFDENESRNKHENDETCESRTEDTKDANNCPADVDTTIADGSRKKKKHKRKDTDLDQSTNEGQRKRKRDGKADEECIEEVEDEIKGKTNNENEEIVSRKEKKKRKKQQES